MFLVFFCFKIYKRELISFYEIYVIFVHFFSSSPFLFSFHTLKARYRLAPYSPQRSNKVSKKPNDCYSEMEMLVGGLCIVSRGSECIIFATKKPCSVLLWWLLLLILVPCWLFYLNVISLVPSAHFQVCKHFSRTLAKNFMWNYYWDW